MYGLTVFPVPSVRSSTRDNQTLTLNLAQTPCPKHNPLTFDPLTLDSDPWPSASPDTLPHRSIRSSGLIQGLGGSAGPCTNSDQGLIILARFRAPVFCAWRAPLMNYLFIKSNVRFFFNFFFLVFVRKQLYENLNHLNLFHQSKHRHESKRVAETFSQMSSLKRAILVRRTSSADFRGEAALLWAPSD